MQCITRSKERKNILKPVDKESAIVIWNKEDYLKESNEHFNNEHVCEKCNEIQAVQLNTEIQSTLSIMLPKKDIDKKVMNYLIKKNPQLG